MNVMIEERQVNEDRAQFLIYFRSFRFIGKVTAVYCNYDVLKMKSVSVWFLSIRFLTSNYPSKDFVCMSWLYNDVVVMWCASLLVFGTVLGMVSRSVMGLCWATDRLYFSVIETRLYCRLVSTIHGRAKELMEGVENSVRFREILLEVNDFEDAEIMHHALQSSGVVMNCARLCA